MGQHYVPQRYLRAFASAGDSRRIWMFDKRSRRWTLAAISKVAQERDFYGAKIEQQLNEKIEKPGSLALEKLRRMEPLSVRHRRDAALYIATMMGRVPKRRRMTAMLVPRAVEAVLQEVLEALASWEAGGANMELLAKRRAEFEEVAKKVRTNPINSGVEQVINSPFPSENILNCVNKMVWRAVHAKGRERFVTSDNPMNSFDHLGIGRPESEFVFPLSPTTAIFANWVGENGIISHFEAEDNIIREANRRIVHWAERFIFSSVDERWVSKDASICNPQFNRINWIEV